MMRQLTALAVVGFLGVALAGNAEACHKNKCGRGCGNTTACVTVVSYCQPVACAAPVKHGCGHRARKCGGGLFSRCHKKRACAPAPCAAPVAYTYNYTTVAPSGQYMGTPQATGQQMVAPPVPSKR